MKHCLLTLASLLVAASTYAQGTVNFVNRIANVLDAQVRYANSGAPIPANGDYVAQLYASAPGGTLAAVGAAIPFRTGSGEGYWPGDVRTIPGVPAGGTAQIQVKAWASSLGTSFESVQAQGIGGWGESGILAAVPTGGAGVPPSTPTPLTGLASFEIATIIPEPSIAALGLLGAGLLLLRRKK